MFGIYEYKNGLEFTGMVCKDYETAERYLGNKYGRMEEVAVSFDGEKWVYEKVFKPWYNKEAFKIKELTVIE